MSFYFLKPIALILLLLIPLLFYIYYISLKKKKEAAIKFSSLGIVSKSLKSKFSWRKHIEFISAALILFFLILALADPHFPLKQKHEGVNVVIVLDTSGSMNIDDYKPNRLEAAKRSAILLVDNLNLRDHVGVVLFDSGARTAAFLTSNKERVKDKISGISQPNGMTAIGDGLALAVDMITSIPNKKKVIVFMSDGVNNAGVINPNEAIKFAKDNNIQVFTVGMGSIGRTLLGYDWFGNPVYDEGLDEEILKLIAHETKGKYYRSIDSSTLDEIYKNIPDQIEREKEDTSIKSFFIILAILVLIIDVYIRYGKYRVIRG
jgi:Ca-activated chloride channel homolog